MYQFPLSKNFDVAKNEYGDVKIIKYYPDGSKTFTTLTSEEFQQLILIIRAYEIKEK